MAGCCDAMIVVSNGFSKFHIATAAARAAAAGRLERFITGAYPTPLVRNLAHLSGTAGQRKLGRLLARREDIPDDRVVSLWRSEMYDILARLRGSPSLDTVAAGFAHYARHAVPVVKQAAERGARLYHVRAGFGGPSIAAAKSAGMITICDHSIVHPRLMSALPAAQGKLDTVVPDQDLALTDRMILADVEAADLVLVNSEFVRETFRAVGHDVSRTAVIYQGVDDQFLRQSADLRRGEPHGPLRLHAPAFTLRKGAPALVNALTRLDDVEWRLTITREIDSATHSRFAAFLEDPRVTVDILERAQLPKTMAAHDLVIFPSYAEGSARVIFEALAVGCYVITSPNAGSVITDGVHGRLVPPWNADAIADAIREASARRTELAAIGQRNAAFIREHYSEVHYGAALMALYDRLLEGHDDGSAGR